MALNSIDPIHPLICFFRRLRILTAGLAQIQISGADSAIGVSSHALRYNLFPSNFAWGQAVVAGAMNVLSTHCLVVHLHNVSLVA